MYNILPTTLSTSVSPGGGRFDFDDGGTYCGGWQDGKAHGHGVCTGPKGLGEYSGSWDFGFEVSGVYKWQNGAVYEGKWQNGKRHGVGVEYNGKWIYKGEWTQGYKGRYGVRSSSISAVKYEGTWANGLQDGYGWETYADGGSYQGQWCRGTRHGYGVRASAPYGDKNSNNNKEQYQQQDNISVMGSISRQSFNQKTLGSGGSHSNIMHSSAMDIDDEPFSNEETRPTTERLKASNNGFVLVAKPLEPTPASSKYGDKSSGRRNSLIDKATQSRIPGTYTTATLLRGLRFKKQRSTGDLDSASGNISLDSRHRHQGTDYDINLTTGNSVGHNSPLALSPDELDINDPSTVETYMGEWKHDKRCGHGVCERSDGLKYEGQWLNDMKCGYGITTHRDGTKEEGKYKNNVLIIDSKVKKIFQLRGANLRQKIDEAVELANQAQEVALKKADIAITRAATSRDKAEQATEKAAEALKDSRIAHSVAKQYSDSSQQQQQQAMGNPMLAGMGLSSPGLAGPLHGGILAGGVGMAPGMGGGLESQLRRRLSYFAHHHGGPGMKSGGMHDIHHQSEYDEANNAISMMAHQQHQQHQHQQQQHQLDHQQQHQADNNQQQTTQRPFMNVQDNSSDLHDSPSQQNHNLQQFNQQRQQHQQRYLGPLEPFGGRRGSFRVTAGGALPTTHSHQPQQHHHHHQMGAGNSLTNNSRQQQLTGTNMLLQTDPFNDHFDHYRTNSSSITQLHNNSSSFDSSRSTRSRILKKQTSFDQSNLRQFNTNSVYNNNANTSTLTINQTPSPHSSGLGGTSVSSKNTTTPNKQQQINQQNQFSRRNSIDNYNQNNNTTTTGHNKSFMENIDLEQSHNSNSSNNQHQFSHLVTSGEDLLTDSNQLNNNNHHSNNSNSNYSPNSNTQHATSTFYGSQASSPSPIDLLNPRNSTNESIIDGNTKFHNQYNHHHQLRLNPMYGGGGGGGGGGGDSNTTNNYNNYNQTMRSGSEPRQTRHYGLQRQTTTANNFHQFSIGPSPASAARTRRTASLTRNPFTPSLLGSSSFLKNSINLLSTNQPVKASTSTRTGSVTAMSLSMANRNNNNQIFDNNNVRMATLNPNQQLDTLMNHMPISTNESAHVPPNTKNTSALGSSGLSLSRKPSLQVRYDPQELGGLMSREEVSALSHAQREHRRLEAELAERRRKNPILYFLLAAKELINSQKLVLAVLLVNITIFLIFVDLLSG